MTLYPTSTVPPPILASLVSKKHTALSLLGLWGRRRRRRAALYRHSRRPFHHLSLFVLLLDHSLEHLGDHVQLAVSVGNLQSRVEIWSKVQMLRLGCMNLAHCSLIGASSRNLARDIY